jgi:mRNA interferase YafQ
MRTIERASAFKRDYKRVKAAPRHARDIDLLLPDILTALATDEVLPIHNRDHALTGNWIGYRECHIKPDLLLIYRKPDENTLRLARLGSHSSLFRL